MKGDLQRIRDKYGVPAYKGRDVWWVRESGERHKGVILSAGKKCLRVELFLHGKHRTLNFDPSELEYLPDGAK
jgi:hypothetical protein